MGEDSFGGEGRVVDGGFVDVAVEEEIAVALGGAAADAEQVGVVGAEALTD